MDITFERGSQGEPKGHALLYFTSSLDPEEVWGTYLVMLPITVDVSKYVPPFLMNQLGDLGPKDLSAFAFPPSPEKLEGRQYLEGLAEMRDDDILYGGSFNPSDVAAGVMGVNEAVQRYAQIYADLVESRQPSKSLEEEASGGFGVNEVMYGLMSDNDRLNELTKLVGRLRFAVEGSEEALVKEAEADINLLAQHLPEGHQAPRLIEAVKSRDAKGARLADLYLKRCFHMVQEDYAKLGEVEAEIRVLEGEGSSS
jgi:hypothetical protein